MPVLDADRLRYEMAIRGLLGADLARKSGVDANTISRGLSGKPVRMRTLMRITSALLSQPPLRLTADIIAKPTARRSDVEKFE